MKTFSVAVAVAVVLAFICLQESSAVPAAEIQELKEMMSNGTLAAALEEMSEEAEEAQDLKELMNNGDLAAALEEMSQESEEVPSNNRQKRGLRKSIKKRLKKFFKSDRKECRFCCNCSCGFSGCGTCCRF